MNYTGIMPSKAGQILWRCTRDDTWQISRNIFCALGRLGTGNFKWSFDGGHCKRSAAFVRRIVSHRVSSAPLFCCEQFFYSLQLWLGFSFQSSQSFCCSHNKYIFVFLSSRMTISLSMKCLAFFVISYRRSWASFPIDTGVSCVIQSLHSYCAESNC